MTLSILPPDDYMDNWTVRGDLREVIDLDGDSTNYVVAETLDGEGQFVGVSFDPELSCFYAYCMTQDEAIAVRDEALRTAQQLLDLQPGGPDGLPEPWLNNEVQFARLLCEINATQDTLDLDALAESMDLDRDQVVSLFDRANDVWERVKGNR